MTLKRIIPNLLTTVLLVTGPVFMLFAQEDTSSTQPDRTYNFFGPSGYSDEMFISKNIEDNTKEIELAKLALDKSSNGSIKSIAQDMVEHHGKLLEDLKQLRSVSGISGISGNEEDAVAEEQEQVVTEENNMQNDSASVTNPPANVNLYDPAAMLVNASPEQFDSMWVRQMLIDHKIKLGELHQAGKTTDNPKIKSLVKEAIPMVRNMRDKLENVNDPQFTTMIWKKE